MSLEGKATATQRLRGKINRIDVIHTDTYEIAVKNGFEGTVEEWLATLPGKDGIDGKDGTNGKDGVDGISPTVSVFDVTGGHQVRIVDKDGAHDVFVRDGKDGTNGKDGAVAVDTTLSLPGYAADAKAVGDALANAGGGGATDITSAVSVTCMGSEQTVIKAVDNGNTITILVEGDSTENSIFVNGHTGTFIGGYMYGVDSNSDMVDPVAMFPLNTLPGGSLSATSYNGCGVSSGKYGIVIHYV